MRRLCRSACSHLLEVVGIENQFSVVVQLSIRDGMLWTQAEVPMAVEGLRHLQNLQSQLVDHGAHQKLAAPPALEMREDERSHLFIQNPYPLPDSRTGCDASAVVNCNFA